MSARACLYVALAWSWMGHVAVVCAAAGAAPDPPATWSFDAAVGFDSFRHTYALATTDTSETVNEARATIGWERRSRAGAVSPWRLRLEASAGTDLWREHCEADWRRRDGAGVTRIRAKARLDGRQYRTGTDYTQSSDHLEARLDLQAAPLTASRCEAYLSGWAAGVDYDRPSPLEQDQREGGGGVGLRSRGDGADAWQVAIRHGARSYPDSTAINRRSWNGEAEWAGPLGATGLVRAYGRSERRLAADTLVRPHAWLHWLDASAQVPLAGGDLVLEAQAERWDYDTDSEIHVDSTRASAYAGLRRGDILGPQWQLGFAGERFDSAAAAESYLQGGLRAGIESFGTRLSGSCTVEYGRRDYGEQPTVEGVPTWTDFGYWRLWLLAEYGLAPDLALSALASWEPESHVEPQDDVALGFASLRLVWRP